jgi:hypothetical protein
MQRDYCEAPDILTVIVLHERQIYSQHSPSFVEDLHGIENLKFPEEINLFRNPGFIPFAGLGVSGA